MVSLRHQSETPEDRKVLQRIWAADLADLPLYSVERACADFRQGRAGDGKWLPTQAEVRAVAMRYVEKLRKEQADVLAVLGAEVMQPIAAEQKGRVLRKWGRIRDEIVAKADPWAKDPKKPYSQITPTEAQAALDRIQADSPPPLAVSAALRAVLDKPMSP